MQLVAYLAQLCACNEHTHFLVALRVLKYLYTARENKLTLRGGWPTKTNGGDLAKISMYSDYDWAMVEFTMRCLHDMLRR